MNVELKYGNATKILQLPASHFPELINPLKINSREISEVNIIQAINSPLDAVKLSDKKSARTVAIAINDKTRPVRYDLLLPPLIKSLQDTFGKLIEISFYISSGTHAPMTLEECSKIIPAAIASTYPVYVHNCDASAMTYLGITSRNTPVYVNTSFYESDIKIVVGNIEPHHFMGFSGGVKTAAIGLASRATINTNHTMLITEANTVIGEYENNPMRMDVEEIGDMIGIDYALNVVQSTDKELIEVFFGKPRAVMQRAIDIVRKYCQVGVTQQYDVTIASAGGYPKDINLYQSQKAITNAAKLTKTGGMLILFAQCSEGIGNSHLESFMQGIKSTSQIRDKLLSQGFQVGPHKAYLLARDIDRINIHLVSDMEADLVKSLLLHPVCGDSGEFVLNVLSKLSSEGKVAIIPNAVVTIPTLVR